MLILADREQKKSKKGDKGSRAERELGVEYHQYGFDMQFLRRQALHPFPFPSPVTTWDPRPHAFHLFCNHFPNPSPESMILYLPLYLSLSLLLPPSLCTSLVHLVCIPLVRGKIFSCESSCSVAISLVLFLSLSLPPPPYFCPCPYQPGHPASSPLSLQASQMTLGSNPGASGSTRSHCRP